MEIDFHLYPYRSTTPGSTKRARSPDPGPLDRPSKRPVVVLSRPSSAEYFTIHSRGVGKTCPSDDWVSQAGYLSIDSPIVIETTSDSEQDAPMDDSQAIQPSLDPLHVSSINARELSQLPMLVTESQRQCKVNKASPSPPSCSLCTECDSYSNTTGISVASVSSAVQGDSQTSISRLSRKSRFAMGPRADCDLCRRGIKGHSAHWN
ncbi:hypothetical protein APHAL10511_007062 [Amanita phalloides]|nr:hypothetical protein APHAL10511_007062 [Amanita phalloides]